MLICQKWFDKNRRLFQIVNFRKLSKKAGFGPKFRIRITKAPPDNSLRGIKIIIGYIVFNYKRFY